MSGRRGGDWGGEGEAYLNRGDERGHGVVGRVSEERVDLYEVRQRD